VKRDIPLGELMDRFESAGHSRLVVYNETLDDPIGIVHIRDLRRCYPRTCESVRGMVACTCLMPAHPMRKALDVKVTAPDSLQREDNVKA